MALGFADSREANRGTFEIRAKVFLNGAGVIDNTANKGRNTIVTRTGVGTATVKLDVPAREVLFFKAEMGKAAILNRMLHVIGAPAQGTDGKWTYTLALTDLNNAGVAATEWAGPATSAFLHIMATVQLVGP